MKCEGRADITSQLVWQLAAGFISLALLLCVHQPLGAQDTANDQNKTFGGTTSDLDVPPETPMIEEARVGLYLSPPFVMKEGNDYTGMAVELWETLARESDVAFEYAEFGSYPDLLSAVQSGEVDLGVTSLTITEDRVSRVDFTQPWFDGGLQIMVSDEATSGFSAVFQGLVDSGHLEAFAWLAFIIVVATLAITLFDRRFDKDFPEGWPEGLSESFYSVMSIATSGKSPSRKNLFGWPGRIFSAFWLLCGVAVLAYITSAITSVMTTLALTNQINGLADLPGKEVGVLSGSTAEEFATRSSFRTVGYENIDAAVSALVNGEVDAIIGDAPVLDYYAHTREQHDVTVVGELFEPDKYGFALAHTSPYTRAISVDIVGAREHGTVEELRSKYFGEPN